jgi:EF-P beta-lysylation protein EpmB
VEALLHHLQLDPGPFGALPSGDEQFGLLVPHGFVERMEKGNPDDPLLRQVLPTADEWMEQPGFSQDPVGDGDATRSPGLLQKYQGRALLVVTGACASHCRYCFRRHYPYRESSAMGREWKQNLLRLRTDASVSEVILSGGDPLMLGDGELAELLQDLHSLPHIRRVRIHTRLPVTLPERISDELLLILRESGLPMVLVLHCNHRQELSNEVAEALHKLADAGITLLNQSVLLRGVNDSAEVLCDLSEALFELGVLPYYLHLLDRVAGAAHFEVPLERARALEKELRRRLPGYLLPRFVYEQAGAAAKLPLHEHCQ